MAQRFPISIKGVVLIGSRVVLLRNERDEWELPGGKLELGENPTDCVAREIEEELGVNVTVGPILDSWLYHIYEGADVFVVTYGCFTETDTRPVHSPEHKELGLFLPDEVEGLNMPQGYKDSIGRWLEITRQEQSDSILGSKA